MKVINANISDRLLDKWHNILGYNKMKTKREIVNSGRGYIIRRYIASTGKSLFYTGTNIGKANTWGEKISDPYRKPKLFSTARDAEIVIDERLKKIKAKKGDYFYISKCFYKTLKTSGLSRVILKLTRPDKHDFLNNL